MGFILRQHLKFHNYVQLSIPLISEFCYKTRHPLTRMTCGTVLLEYYMAPMHVVKQIFVTMISVTTSTL